MDIEVDTSKDQLTCSSINSSREALVYSDTSYIAYI